MSLVMIRSKVKAEGVAALEAAATRAFAAIQQAQPKGVRYYTASRLPDGQTYVAVLDLEDGIENPLPAIPEFREFLEAVEATRAEPAVVEPLTVIGVYPA